MSADFESELAALYGRQPDLPDASHFALDVSERIVREERRNFLFSAVTVAGLLVLVASAATSTGAATAMASSTGKIEGLLDGVVRSTESLPALSSPVMLAAAAVVAIGAILFGRMQARRL